MKVISFSFESIFQIECWNVNVLVCLSSLLAFPIFNIFINDVIFEFMVKATEMVFILKFIYVMDVAAKLIVYIVKFKTYVELDKCCLLVLKILF